MLKYTYNDYANSYQYTREQKLRMVSNEIGVDWSHLPNEELNIVFKTFYKTMMNHQEVNHGN